MVEGGTVEDLFKIQIETEEVGRDYYANMAEKFEHLSDILNFFDKMSKDEEFHIQNLKDVRDSMSQKELQMPAEQNILFNAREANNLKKVIEQRLSSLKTLDDCYDVAHKLEYSELNNVYRHLVDGFSDRAEFKKEVTLKLQEHMQRLMEFSDKFSQEQRKSILLKGGK